MARDRKPQAPKQRRSVGRRRLELLYSNLGPVLDLSCDGVRVLSTRRLRGRQIIKLHVEQGVVEFRAEVRWSRRLGFRRHEVGMLFENLADHQRRLLAQISTLHRKIHFDAA